MHPNPAYRQMPEEANLSFARDRAFGTLVLAGPDGPLVSHIPFLIADDGRTADLHLVRSNPIARITDAPAAIAVAGPDAYVSPDWYGIPDQVPTWNYIAVHLRGRLARLPEDALRGLLDRQAAAYETRLAPKPAWTTAKMTQKVLDRLMRAILPFRFEIETIDGTWKLSQNKDSPARRGAADGVAGAGFGQETGALAALMRQH